jgi:hypothetical protein
VREADRLATIERWDELVALREACLAATEETGRQLWGPARYAAYRIALDGPAPLAASMLEPGVVRFGLGPLTEVVAQQHSFAMLAPHLDVTLLPVVAQERILRGEDLRGELDLADDDPPAVLQPFEPAYTVPLYRAQERVDGSFVPSASGSADAPWRTCAPTADARDDEAGRVQVPSRARALARVLEESVAVWEAQSSADVTTASVVGTQRVVAGPEFAAAGLGRDGIECRPLSVADLFGLVAFAAASGGVRGRRRGGAAGRAHAWWLARTAVGMTDAAAASVDDLEFALEDLRLLELRSPGEAAWRLELSIGDPAGEWAVALSALDREEAAQDPAQDAPGDRADALGAAANAAGATRHHGERGASKPTSEEDR